MEYETTFYANALADVQIKLTELHKELEAHSSGTPRAIEIGKLIQALREEIEPLRKLAYFSNPCPKCGSNNTETEIWHDCKTVTCLDCWHEEDSFYEEG